MRAKLISLFLCSPGSYSRKCCYPQWLGLLILVNLIKAVPHRHAQRMMSCVNIGFIKVIMEINHQSYVETEYDKIKNTLLKF